MQYIKEALEKAKVSLESATAREQHEAPRSLAASLSSQATRTAWRPRSCTLDGDLLERNRIVSYSTANPSHLAFNLLRTRVRQALKDNGWKSVAVTSPTSECGKTVVALNLAFSLARACDRNVVLIDLDLRRPKVAETLGIKPDASIGRYLEGAAPIDQCFVEVAEKLVVGCSDEPVALPSELIQGPRLTQLIAWVSNVLAPEVVVFDLPPMRAGDDAIAFLPHVHTALLVLASGQTTAAEAGDCEQQISHAEKLLGIVLNKCGRHLQEYYY